MADENQAPQNAIPPKAVPPQAVKQPTQILPVAAPTPVPSTAPRTVRLKPVQVPVPATGTGGAALPPMLPSAPPGSAAAAEAIKRMTSHLSGISSDAAPAKKATVPMPAMSPPEPRKATSRLNVPGVAPALEVPKTIKIRPIAVPPSATQPMPAADVGAAPLPSKSKTSRIPLETAMGLGSGDPSAPKTIRLKRPGDMSTVRVTVPGGSAGDSSAITQKRTIKVKRPMSAAMPGAAAEGDEGASALFTVPTAAPERGTGIFIAVAAICALAIIALMVVFSSQIFGPNASLTELSVWPGLDIPLPGTIAAEG